MTTREDNAELRAMGIDVCPECQALHNELDVAKEENQRAAEFTVEFCERFKAKVKRWQTIAFWGWATCAAMLYIWIRRSL